MGNRHLMRCFVGDQGMPCSGSRPVLLYSLTGMTRIMVVKTALVLTILFILALSCVCEGLIQQSAGATDGSAASFVDQEAKVGAPVRRRNRAAQYTNLLSSRTRLAGASSQAAGNDREETVTKASLLKPASKRQHLRKMLTRRLQDVADGNCNAVAVAARFRSAQFRRKMGPITDGTASPQRIRPLTSRPVKALFILCAKKKTGVRVTLMTSSSRLAAPTLNQRYISSGNHHRRALMQLPSLPIPPLPFTQSPASTRLRFPPLPFSPALPQSQLPPQRPITLPNKPFPFINIPPLPFQLPPIPCVPSSSGNSLPPP